MSKRHVFFVFALGAVSLSFVGDTARADVSPTPLAALECFQGESGLRCPIPASQLQNYVQNFNVESYAGEDGVDHARVIGWIPQACQGFLNIRLGNPEGGDIFDSEKGHYAVYVEAHPMEVDGQVVQPHECFNEHRATACNRSRDPSVRNCVAASEIADFSNLALTESGNLAHCVESTELDAAGTGAPAAPTCRTLTHYTSSSDIYEREMAEERTALCNAAASGDRDAIARLREFAGMVEVAERYQHAADQRDFDELKDRRVRNLDEAEAKARDLHRFARAHREFEDDAADALITLAATVRDDIEAGDDDNAVRFSFRSLNVRERILGYAQDHGGSARVALDRLSIERLMLSAQNPDAEMGNYQNARRRLSRLMGRFETRARSESRRRLENRPYSEMLFASARLLGPYRDARGNFFGGEADSVAQQAWQGAAARGDYNDFFQQQNRGLSYGGNSAAYYQGYYGFGLGW